jgi:2,3,4,5-tetrahydropyridine-2-carboxylate N-succinyltransferase
MQAKKILGSHWESSIEALWQQKKPLDPDSDSHRMVAEVIDALDRGTLRMMQPREDRWELQSWVKKAILLWFRLQSLQLFSGGPSADDGDTFLGLQQTMWYDKIRPKTLGWTEEHFEAARFRLVPGAIVRHGAYLAQEVVVMPSFINIGAWVGQGTMIDSGATVGSGVTVGAHCHIASGVVLGGVLEPLQEHPVVIEDGCFIGAGSSVTEGFWVREGAVVASGVHLSQSTPVWDRTTGRYMEGTIPPNAVVVPGFRLDRVDPSVGIAMPIIAKYATASTRDKTAINRLLREVIEVDSTVADAASSRA